MASGRRRARRRTGVFKGRLRTTRFRAGVETPPAPDKRLARPSRPPRLFERHGPGCGWLQRRPGLGSRLCRLTPGPPRPWPARRHGHAGPGRRSGRRRRLRPGLKPRGRGLAVPGAARRGGFGAARKGQGLASAPAARRPAPRPVSSRQRPKRKAPARARGPGGGFDKRPCYSAAKTSASPGAAGAAARVWRATASGATVSGEPASSWGGRTRRNSGATALDRWAVAKGLRV